MKKYEKAIHAVDLDGTLAEYHGWRADGAIGKPVPEMLDRVLRWLDDGDEVEIFTARIYPLDTRFESEDPRRTAEAKEQKGRIQDWLREHVGMVLPITCIKRPVFKDMWDDRAVQVEENTGRPIKKQVEAPRKEK